jgi:hypothetical protein
MEGLQPAERAVGRCKRGVVYRRLENYIPLILGDLGEDLIAEP